MILAFDVETTGLNEPEIIEAAWVELKSVSPITAVNEVCNYYKPSKPIELGALATHHIMDEDLVDCPPSSSFKLPDGVQYIVAHNADFDCNIAKVGDSVKRICTLAMARHVWPTLGSHKLGALIYYLDRKNARWRLKSAHSASADVQLCLDVLRAIVAAKGFKTIEEVYQFSELSRIPITMGFGKHKGMAIADLPVDYCQWFLGQTDIDNYLRIALERSLKNREALTA